MTPLASPATSGWSIESAMQEVRTPIGRVLMATAGAGVFIGAHWQPLVLLMLPFYFATVLAPSVARRSEVWFAVAGLWSVAVVIRRSAMEDHVYLYLAWLFAIAVALLHKPNFLDEVARQGRYLLAVVFGFATFWKLISGSFINGAALWTIGLLDDRMAPMLDLAGVSQESLAAARPDVTAVVRGEAASYDIALTGYASVAMVLLSIGTLAIEAAVAVTYAAPDSSWLARLRAPILVAFGIVTYAVVPVLPFALLLAIIGCTVARFDRRTVIAFAAMVVITIARFITL